MSTPFPTSPLAPDPLAPDPLPPNPLPQYPPARELPLLRVTQAGKHIGSDFVHASGRATTLNRIPCYPENI